MVSSKKEEETEKMKAKASLFDDDAEEDSEVFYSKEFVNKCTLSD